MDSKTPELVEQCNDDVSEWELRLPELKLMELSIEELEQVGGGQSSAAILD
jgi:hypothetical protein